MKKNLITILIIGIVLIVVAFKPEADKSTGSLGDVKYSILPPDKFIEQNGKGWVLMDDKVLVKGSDLQNCCGVTQIPDARGLFIRGMSLKRADGNEDPFEKENGRARISGEFQADAILEHSHSVTYNFHAVSHFNSSEDKHPGNGSNSEPLTVGEDSDIQIGGVSAGNISNFETRPKNIALFIYIKINN